MSGRAPSPLLVLGVGNPSRGDDALGPLFLERIERALRAEIDEGRVELLTDFQLQIEHALDLEGRTGVVFVDASVRAEDAPFRLSRVEPQSDATATTHALSPAAVLETFRRLARERGAPGEPPASWLLAIAGERFELGEGLTPAASTGLDAATAFFLESLAAGRFSYPSPSSSSASSS